MATKKLLSDVYDVHKKTGALMLGKNRLDDYATNYLRKNYPLALEEPMALPVEEILRKNDLVVKEATLSPNADIFGCCTLLDGNVRVYNPVIKAYADSYYNAGTILIDPESDYSYGEKTRRNTLIHEAIHWEKDRTFFKILQLKKQGEDIYPIMCRSSEKNYEPPEGKKTQDNQLRILEWQAHRLAPRILMPKAPFRQKATELVETVANSNTLVELLSDFFMVSKSSVKYRLIEVGMKEKLQSYPDFEDCFAELYRNTDFISLTYQEAFELLRENSTLQKWIDTGRFVFIDGYFVINDSQNITYKDGVFRLTSRVKRNLKRYVLNIQERIIHSNTLIENHGGYLNKAYGPDRRLILFAEENQGKLIKEDENSYEVVAHHISAYDDNFEIELVTMLGDPRKTLCDCLIYLFDYKNWKYPKQFNEETLLNTDYLGRIKNNKYNNMGDMILLTICIGLQLKSRFIEMMFKKAGYTLDYYTDPYKSIMRYIEQFPGISIFNLNNLLLAQGLEELGSKSKF